MSQPNLAKGLRVKTERAISAIKLKSKHVVINLRSLVLLAYNSSQGSDFGTRKSKTFEGSEAESILSQEVKYDYC